jgi:hypothetical protein
MLSFLQTSLTALMKETESFSETLVSTYESTRHQNPEEQQVFSHATDCIASVLGIRHHA